jgi:hypothetical protein
MTIAQTTLDLVLNEGTDAQRKEVAELISAGVAREEAVHHVFQTSLSSDGFAAWCEAQQAAYDAAKAAKLKA